MGGHTWEEAYAIAEAISEANHDHDIPMFLSLATQTPLQEPNQWPFFIEAVPTQATQITALAAILKSLGMQITSPSSMKPHHQHQSYPISLGHFEKPALS